MHIELIGEIGSNHCGDVSLANRMVAVCADAGVDLVKFQKRNLAQYSKEWLEAPYNSENSYGKTYGEHRAALELDALEFQEIFQTAKECGVGCFATAFDVASVDFLLGLGSDRIKIASGSLTDLELIRYAVKSGAKIYLSTGGGTQEDVDLAANALWHCEQTPVLMQATSLYPCPFDKLNLKTIQIFKTRYPHFTIGASLHDNGIAMAVAAVALGAEVIEKHVTMDRTMKGTDHAFSLEPQGLRKMVRDIRRLEVALGSGEKVAYAQEEPALAKMRGNVYSR